MMPDDSIEEWRPVENTNGHYSVSNLGRVRRDIAARNTYAGRVLKSGLDLDGYVLVYLHVDGRRLPTTRVHQLVVAAFLGPPPTPQHTQVNHLDGNKTNNRVSNLEWQTPAGNNRHARAIGLIPPRRWNSFVPAPRRGETNSFAKLTETDVRFIRTHGHKLSGAALAEIFGVSETTISQVRNGWVWRHVTQAWAERPDE